MESFRSAVTTSKLCQSDTWPLDNDEMAALYDSEIGLLDQLLQLRQVVRRQRTSDPYFDKECRDAKRLTHRLERAYAVASRRATASPNVAVRSPVGPDDVTAAAVVAKEAWYNQRRQYRQLRHRKSAEFWSKKIEADQADLRLLWKSVESLLGRGRMPASDPIDVETFYRFFAEKVSKVRSSTSGAVPPTYSCIRPGVSFAAFSSVSVD